MAKLELHIGRLKLSFITEKKAQNPLRPGEFYYDLPGSKWGEINVSKPKSLLDGKNGKDQVVTSPEFLTTERDWRARPANNNVTDRALAIEEINTGKSAVEGKKKQKSYFKRIARYFFVNKTKS